ncbi:MAG: hypothetical protein QXJ68_08550 [Methanocellales archaeon]
MESLPEKTTNKATVISALAIHAAIKANDSLSLKFIGETAGRHDQAVELFKQMVMKGFVPPEAAGLRDKLEMMVKRKSDADYHSKFFSLRDARGYIATAKSLIELARRLI